MSEYQYDPSKIEGRWQQRWEDAGLFEVSNDLEQLKKKEKFYVLDMFPYPSGAGIHIGHPEGYTATDVIARMKRMQGYNVLHPMGWDAFGLPAERAAVREDIHPAIITKRNVDNFRGQIKRLGYFYDWSREVNTSATDYYKWTQWIFLRLYERDLAYLAEVPVNWCPALGTVLANEEVKDGAYVETGDPVERRTMRQWMLKITAYAEQLIDDLEEVDWPEHVKEMQRNWIGKSEGAEITFEIEGHEGASFSVFTTRPDTLFGCTYCVLAPEHELVETITSQEQQSAVKEYVETARNKTDLQRTDLAKDKTGVFTGAYATHPVTGEPVPVWVADYVLASYGTGAIMAVPGQDERDWEFAEVFDLPILRTVEPPADWDGKAYTGEGKTISSDFLNGMGVAESKQTMIAWLEENGRGTARVEYRLRDWLFSRQRYWGEPFPIAHVLDDQGEPTGEIVALPDDHLPVELPPVDEYRPTDDGKPPLARADSSWLEMTLPDGRRARRETNTMPQWAGSCWYYLRYIDANNTELPFSPELEQYWMPVDLYIGGIEHAVLHLLYARFWHKVLHDAGLVSTKEPFQKLFNQGMILASSYRDEAGKYYSPEDAVESDGGFVTASGVALETRVEKMSKSRLNVVNPDDVIVEYGADALRLYELFMGPLEQVKPWSTKDVEGVYRFLQRTWRLVVDDLTGEQPTKITDEMPEKGEAGYESAHELERLLHKTIQKVTEDITSLRFNTAISQMMVFTNAATGAEVLPRPLMIEFVKLLGAFSPHVGEELWQRLGGPTEFLLQAPWPVHNPALVIDNTITLIVQVNGKKRDSIEVAKDTDKAELERLALASENAQKFMDGNEPKKVIVVPGRLVNIVV